MLIEENSLRMQTYHPWIFLNRDILILHSFLLFYCTYWILMSNFEHPMQFWKVLHRQLYLFKLLKKDCHFFQAVSYQQWLIYLLHLLHLGLKLTPLRFRFLLYSIKGLLFIPFLPCMQVIQNTNIQKNVVLSRKTFETSRWTAIST
jgi:hypothetical protein